MAPLSLKLHLNQHRCWGGSSIDLQLNGPLLVAVGDPASAQVIRCELDLDPVTGQDADVVHPHFPGNMGEHMMTIFEFDLEHGIWQWFDHFALENYCIFF